MALATLLLPIFANEPAQGSTSGSINDFFGPSSTAVATGDPDYGVCLRTASDGKYVDWTGVAAVSVDDLFFFINETAGAIGLSTTINSVKLVVKLAAVNMDFSINNYHPTMFTVGAFPLIGVSGGAFTGTGTYQSAVYTVRQSDSQPFVYDDLFGNSLPNDTSYQGWWSWTPPAEPVPGSSFTVDYIALVVDYTSGVFWYNSSLDQYIFAASSPGAGWVQVADPTVTVAAVYPNQGLSTGAQPVAIDGSGFSNGATVTFNGVAATSVAVQTQHQLTCVTPAFGGVLGATANFVVDGEDPTHSGETVKAKKTAVDVVVTDA